MFSSVRVVPLIEPASWTELTRIEFMSAPVSKRMA
jgi:hypothetical protein